MIVAGERRTLLAGDYSQLELRILAHCSGDRKLRQLVSGDGREQTDPFTHIAATILRTEHVTPDTRELAKKVKPLEETIFQKVNAYQQYLDLQFTRFRRFLVIQFMYILFLEPSHCSFSYLKT